MSDRHLMFRLVLFTSPRVRGEVGSPLAVRVRGLVRKSEYAVKPPYPNLLLARGAKEFAAPRAILSA
jgi:hypothetical protein